jgi:hypothetical protein
MEMVNMPLWAWVLFYILVLVMLLIDLKSFGKKGQHEVGVSEALKMTAVWIACRWYSAVASIYGIRQNHTKRQWSF